jgi:TPR repeat protein
MSLPKRQGQLAATLFLLALIAAGSSPAHAAKDNAGKPLAPATPAVDALKARAQAGDAHAQYELAERYSNGQGLPMDRGLAFRWYGAAAAQGLAKAEYALARYHDGQIGDKLDLQQALALTTRAAEHGHVPAQTELGFLYFNGSGSATRNLPLSFHWFKQAADNGSVPAQCMMGDFYKRGLGNVRQDYAQALKWYRLTAVKDDKCASKSQFELHDLYASGKGVVKDMDTATRWLKKAAEAGNPAAQHTLGRAYQMGYGLPQDPALARLWMRKSREGVAPHDDHEHDDDH